MFEKRLTLFTLVLTFLLLLLGGLVHNTGSSLACPDWPLCYGQVFPKMEGGILIEHSHRLLASLVGLLTLFLMVFLRFQYKKGKLKDLFLVKASFLAFVMVVLQGILGGITVIYKLPTLVSTAHLGLSLIFFSTLVLLHHRLEVRQEGREGQALSLKRGMTFVMVLVYLQIILGAFMRHSGVGASCGLGWEFTIKCLDLFSGGGPQTSWWPREAPAQLHMFHRWMALVVGLAVFFHCGKLIKSFMGNPSSRKRTPAEKRILFLGLLAPLLVVLQIFLGILSVANHVGLLSTTAHLGVAALLLVTLWKLNLLLGNLGSDGKQSLFSSAGPTGSHLSDYWELTKPRLSGLVLVTFLAGAFLSPGHLSFPQTLLLLLAMGMVVGGSCALNCYFERDVDKKMERTKNRAIPSGRLKSKRALIFGFGLLIISFPLLWISSNAITVFLGLLATLFYIFWYTPMKQKSSLALFVGAVPGAIPPVMGWSAATGRIDLMALVLFFILFFWQLSHFLAISIYHANDYVAANIKIFPHLKGIPYTKKSIFLYTILLLLVSFLPILTGEKGGSYSAVSLITGGSFLGLAIYGFRIGENSEKNKIWARQFFLASLFYLPTLFGAMIFS